MSDHYFSCALSLGYNHCTCEAVRRFLDGSAPEREHWLTFSRDREVVGCHCGFRAKESDCGWGDSVVEHLLTVGRDVARAYLGSDA